MDSASVKFVLFGLCVALISNFSRSRLWRSSVLLLATAVFFALIAGHPLQYLPLLGFLLLGYAGIVLVRLGWSRSATWSVVAVIVVYVWLKKYTFIPSAAFLHVPYLSLGLSYIFFRVLHLLIDSSADEECRDIGPFAYLLYTLNFTTFISGPIQRYGEFARDQFATEPIELGASTVGLQLERIVRGFFKVNVLAMLLHALQDEALSQLSQPLLPLWPKLFAAFRVAVLYPLFLYCNFSGYIDIVIALARLMRVQLPENFDRPFSASSVLEFWNRWHITLSNWLKTYVYNPLLLGLMRRIPSRTIEPMLGVFAFFVTFFLIGVWHGRTSEFLFFGLLSGGGISINKLWQLRLTKAMGRKGYNKLARNAWYDAVGRGMNYIWFSFTLFWFWGSWATIHRVFGALSPVRWIGVWLAALLIVTLILALWEWMYAGLLSITTAGEPLLTHRYARVVYMATFGLAAFVVTILLNQSAPDIVYKAF